MTLGGSNSLRLNVLSVYAACMSIPKFDGAVHASGILLILVSCLFHII